MSSLFGGGQSGAVPANNELVDLEKQNAADAKQKEIDRQARLTQGTTAIKNIFEGAPVMGTRKANYDWSKFTAAPPAGYGAPDPTTQNYGLPSGFKTIKTTTPASTTSKQAAAATYTANPNYGQRGQQNPSIETTPDPYTGSATAASSVYAVQGPDGKIYNKGDPLSYDQSYDTGTKSGGFGDEFFNKYRQSILDYYLPQEGQQYNDARSTLNASLARAGTLDSTAAGLGIGKLANQDIINRANIASNADSQTATLRSTIANDEQQALSQLYSTEDPSLAANTATNLASNAQLTKPLLNPASALFNPITVGVGNAISGFLNPTAYINPGAGGSASTASGNQSSGYTGSGNA